ncbi:MAG: hypothetical protein GX565_14630 [Lentisphaerae bacterium]|nr:hypothetical protein [Lentisphaerota bacterium]
MTVRYNGEETGEDEEVDGRNVQLEENFNNRRQTYIISVRVTSPDYPGLGLVIQKQIRVALGSYQGTGVAATTEARRTEVAGLADVPTGFSDTPPGDGTVIASQAWFEGTYGVATSPTINAGNRLQYAALASGAFGYCPFWGVGADRQVFVCMVYPGAYACGLRREDLASVAKHECRHAAQHIAVAAGGNNWRAVDDHFGAPPPYAPLREADAECVELAADGSWYYLLQHSLFVTQYADPEKGALKVYGDMTPGAGKDAAKAILQDIYERIPFVEMKRNDYDWSVEVPE